MVRICPTSDSGVQLAVLNEDNAPDQSARLAYARQRTDAETNVHQRLALTNCLRVIAQEM